jgi:hypothetical protein
MRAMWYPWGLDGVKPNPNLPAVIKECVGDLFLSDINKAERITFYLPEDLRIGEIIGAVSDDPGSEKIQVDEWIAGDAKTGKVFIVNRNGEIRQLMPEKIQKTINHIPEGFMWGYGGSGPEILALAILLEYDPEFLDKFACEAPYQAFKWDVIAAPKSHGKDLLLPANVVKEWIKVKRESWR